MTRAGVVGAMRRVLWAIVYTVVTAALWIALFFVHVVVLIAAGEAPLDCEEGLEEFCGPVTEFRFDTQPLVEGLLLLAAALLARPAIRAVRRAL
jgi:hypothetical protein